MSNNLALNIEQIKKENGKRTVNGYNENDKVLV